jgi:hypothetical protein
MTIGDIVDLARRPCRVLWVSPATLSRCTDSIS